MKGAFINEGSIYSVKEGGAFISVMKGGIY
jgi:hypothetical protein